MEHRWEAETDYLHHIDLTLTGRRQVVFRGEIWT
jgi:hypothetical protein